MTTRLEFIGSTVRRSPRSPGVKPSVARMTWRARTSPRAVRARPSSMAVTVVSSWIVTPRRSTAAARPATSRAGCRVAQCGCHSEPTASATRTRAAVAAASSSSVSVCGQVASAAAVSRSRASWAALRATSSSPPRAMPASMPSRSATATTSATDAVSARCWAIAGARSPRRTYCSRPPVTLLVSQPPLRPDAPNPAKRASSTTTARSGRARLR